jgi:hypothetical protein
MANPFTDEIKQQLLGEFKKLVDEAVAKDGVDGLYPYARWIASQKRKNARKKN